MVMILCACGFPYAQIALVTDTLTNLGEGVPDGYYTLRIYVSSTNENDLVNAVVGSSQYPLSISIHGGDVWNHPTFGGAHSGQVNCNLQVIDPSQRFDSFVTVGDTCGNNVNTINVVEDPGATPWLLPFFQPTDSVSNQISINSVIGGGWFVTGANASNTMGDDLKVLIAQITTNGTVCGVLNVQVADSSGINTLHTGLSFGPEACSGICNLSANWSVQQPICYGDFGSITAEPSNGFAPFILRLEGIEQVALSAEELAGGNYVASIEDAFGCIVEDTIVLVTIEPIVPVGLSAVPINTSAGGNTEYYITGGTSPYVVMWSGPNGFFSDDFNLPSLTDVADSGDYILTITDANGCSFSQSLLITDYTERDKMNFQLYPNPTSGDLILEGEWSGNFSLRDLSGKELPFEILKTVDGLFKLNIGMRSGPYILSDHTNQLSYLVVVY